MSYARTTVPATYTQQSSQLEQLTYLRRRPPLRPLPSTPAAAAVHYYCSNSGRNPAALETPGPATAARKPHPLLRLHTRILQSVRFRCQERCTTGIETRPENKKTLQNLRNRPLQVKHMSISLNRSRLVRNKRPCLFYCRGRRKPQPLCPASPRIQSNNEKQESWATSPGLSLQYVPG